MKGVKQTMLKSIQTNKYETSCFVQESPVLNKIGKNYKVLTSVEGLPYVQFQGTLQTYNCTNRMKRRYDRNNAKTVTLGDERVMDLQKRNQLRGEWNHPNPDIKGTELTDIRLTCPAPQNTAHFLTNIHFTEDAMRSTITTHPRTESGRAIASEIIDLGAQPAYSVRILATMIPNAALTQPNMRILKFITADQVDYPSHPGALSDITPTVMEQYSSVIFLKELAKYCTEQDENLKVVCESFEITPDEIKGLINNSIVVMGNDMSSYHIPLKGEIRAEAISILRNRGL